LIFFLLFFFLLFFLFSCRLPFLVVVHIGAADTGGAYIAVAVAVPAIGVDGDDDDDDDAYDADAEIAAVAGGSPDAVREIDVVFVVD
jgi:hypothetical protein